MNFFHYISSNKNEPITNSYCLFFNEGTPFYHKCDHLTQFLSNRSQHVMVDGCRSKLVIVVSGLPQGSVLGPLLFLLYTLELYFILENKLIMLMTRL